jgi:AhpD family alkylhydroperoxidase
MPSTCDVCGHFELPCLFSEPHQQLRGPHALVEKAAADAGLDQLLIELVKIRGSMLNGCSFCLDLHARNARGLGETERCMYLLGA